MNIKELLLEGCVIEMPYKEEEEEWVSGIKIYIFAGGCGLNPYIVVEGYNCSEHFKVEEIDNAIALYVERVFNPKNLMYKISETIIEICNSGYPDIDMDEKEDYNMVRKNIDNKLKNTIVIVTDPKFPEEKRGYPSRKNAEL